MNKHLMLSVLFVVLRACFMGNNILKGFIMTKRLMLAAFLMTGLGFSVVFAQTKIQEKNQNIVTDVIDTADYNSETELKIVEALAEELEKRIADVKTEADLNELVKETKELVCQLDEVQRTCDAEFLKLAALGAVEGLALPVGFTLGEWIKTKKLRYDNDFTPLFIGGIVASALSKALAGKVGTLPKAKLSDFLTRQEIIKSLIAGVAQVGIFYGLLAFLGKIMNSMNLNSPKWAQISIGGLYVAAPAVSTAIPSSITALLKRVEKRNAAKRVIANRDNN